MQLHIWRSLAGWVTTSCNLCTFGRHWFYKMTFHDERRNNENQNETPCFPAIYAELETPYLDHNLFLLLPC